MTLKFHSFKFHSFSLLCDFQRRKCFNPLDYLSAYLFRYNSLIPNKILTKVCSYSSLDQTHIDVDKRDTLLYTEWLLLCAYHTPLPITTFAVGVKHSLAKVFIIFHVLMSVTWCRIFSVQGGQIGYRFHPNGIAQWKPWGWSGNEATAPVSNSWLYVQAQSPALWS